MNRDEIQSKTNYAGAYFWRIASSHAVAYFIAGIFAVVFMNYREHYASEALSGFMRPVDSPWVALGPALQLIRGTLIALILLPFRKAIFEENYGWLKLALLVLGLSFLSTVGPTPGSFEGFIYTKLEVPYHLLGYPEAVIYAFLFSFASVTWQKHPRRTYTVISVVLMVLILLMSFLGFLQSTGRLKTGGEKTPAVELQPNK